MKQYDHIFVILEILTRATIAVSIFAAAICCMSFSIFFAILFLIKLV